MKHTLHGLVAGVRAEILGAGVTAAAAPGATVLTVDDASDFNPTGGWLQLPDGSLAAYDVADLEDDSPTANQITLAAGLAVALAADDRLVVWDTANTLPAVRYYASVDEVDGLSGRPVDVEVDQSIAHVLATNMRAGGPGESVQLEHDGSGLRLTRVDGRHFALAALQYLQAGLTTRQRDDDAGVELLGNDSGTPGFYAYAPGGDPTVLVNALTGDASFIGELGTALPGDLGIFLFSQTFSQLGALVTNAVMQFNTGASRDQPSIQGDSAGSGAGVYIYSGAATGGRESRVVVEQAQILLQTERTADSSPDFGTQLQLNDDSGLLAVVRKGTGGANGGLWILANDQIVYQTDYTFGSANKAAVLIGNITSYQAGFRDNSDGSMEGLWLTRGGDVVLSTVGAVDVQNPGNTAFKPVNASAFNVSSDRASKRDLEPGGGGLDALRAAPAYRYRYAAGEDADSRVRLGPLAEDLPAWVKTRRPADVGPHAGTEMVDLHGLVGILWQAEHEHLAEVDDLRSQIAELRDLVETLKEH